MTKRKYPHPYRRGQAVTNYFHGIRRYGIVTKSWIAEDGWRYLNVHWVDDGAYEKARAWEVKLGQEDRTLHEYRVDQVELFDHADAMYKITLLANKRTEMFGFNADERQGKEISNG
jgi:hypothetical protein